MGHIVVIGSINMDVVVRVPHIPAVGETILASHLDYFSGGKGANQAVAAAKLGADVRMIGRLGNDNHGSKLYNELAEAGVSAASVEFDAACSSGTAYICVSDRGENNIVVYPGANGKVDKEQLDRHAALLDGAEYCIIQMEIPVGTVEYAVELCRRKGVKVLLNPAPAQSIGDRTLDGLYLIVPNETELEILCGSGGSVEERARLLYDKGVQNVIVTLGSKGALLLNAEGVREIPAAPFKAVDTTAAGDAFIGGLTVGLSEGMDMERSIVFASYVAGIAVSRRGAQSSLPDRKTVDSYL